MDITRRSPITREVRTLDLPVTKEQIAAWEGGELIQKAMPHLSDDEREFIMTGITSEEWDTLFKEE